MKNQEISSLGFFFDIFPYYFPGKGVNIQFSIFFAKLVRIRILADFLRSNTILFNCFIIYFWFLLVNEINDVRPV